MNREAGVRWVRRAPWALTLWLAWASGAGGVEPFQKALKFSVNAGFSGVCADVTNVPADKRLVLEYVSAQVQPPAGQHCRSLSVRTKVGQDDVFHNVSVAPTGVFNECVGAQKVQIYADPSTSVKLCVDRDITTGSMKVNASVSGQLLDLP